MVVDFFKEMRLKNPHKSHAANPTFNFSFHSHDLRTHEVLYCFVKIKKRQCKDYDWWNVSNDEKWATLTTKCPK